MAGRGNFGFPPCLRLRTPVEFQFVFAKPVKSSDRCFTVFARPNELGYPRLGLAVAKKNIRKAVERNRIKRSVRESFRLNQHVLDSLDVIVLARRDASASDLQDLRIALARHWGKLADRCG